MATSEQKDRRNNGSARRPKKSRRKRRSIFLTIPLRLFQLVGTILLICVVTGCFLACYATYYVQTVIIPDAGMDLSQYALNESSVIVYYDPVTGEEVELRTLSGKEDRVWADYEEIPDYFKKAAVAIEDKDFWTHQGVDWWRTAGAVFYMFTGQDVQGGSTITQQLIKNMTGERDVTVNRKIGEIFNALEFEKNYKKEDILMWYLNEIYLGAGKYGIVTASKYYFGKELSEITLAEAASIVAITNNPSIYSPAATAVIENRHGEPWNGVQWNKYRQELILDQMYKQGIISEAERDAAIAQELNFVFDDEEAQSKSGKTFSWYEEAVIDEVVSYLVEEHGLESRLAYDIVYGGGLVIYTAYDPRVQACVDEIYGDVSNLPYISADGQQMQSAITIVDNATGYVVALGGKLGEKTGNLQKNYATDALRQPGSSLKPLSAYSPAVEMGLVLPSSIIDDVPYQANITVKDEEEIETLWPRNDDRLYRGLVTIKQGITRSLNTVAVQLVGDYVGPQNSYRFLTERYGLTTLVERETINGQVKSDIVLAPLALGGLTKGVTTFEMAAAYATFPRGGAFTEPTTVLRVESKSGVLIWDNEPKTEYVIKDTTAYYMNQLLYNAANEGTGKRALVAGQDVAGKTGTTSDNYDRWFAGFTPYYTGVVWAGYPYNASITGTDGNPAAVMWNKVMTLVHEGLEHKSLYGMEKTTTVSICLDCGQLATDACANDIRKVMGGSKRTENFTYPAGKAPTSFCTCHVPITICWDDPVEGVNGAFHLAGEDCPSDRISTVYVVAHKRSEVGQKATVSDAQYLMSFYDALKEEGNLFCSVHGYTYPPLYSSGTEDPYAGYDWSQFDPMDGRTWPFDPDSNPGTWPFNPYDPSTWPEAAHNSQQVFPPEEEYLPAGRG